MNQHALFHISDTPWAFARDDDTLTVRLRTAHDVTGVRVLFKDRYEWVNTPWQSLSMETMAKTGLFVFWTADLTLRRARFRYLFEIEGKDGRIYSFDERGIRANEHHEPESQAFQFPYINSGEVYRGKEDMAEAVVYQIFPERFYNGDSGNDPENTLPWGGVPQRYSSFGGDIQGIIEKLDYLEDLGIDLLYLTPIFRSTSNHKYNIKDYYEIDPQFGTLEDAKNLVAEAHARGIKVYFDAVFNHTGSDFFAFQDILKNQEKSRYLDWYHLDSLPVSLEETNYYTFATDIPTMPKLRTENPEVRDYLFQVGRYWIREIGIDGWRLDVCDEVDHSFWQGFRTACEEMNPKVALVGEIMHESSAFLKGRELDSIMNYPFKYAVTDFFARRTMSLDSFMDLLSANRVLYMDKINRQMWNLIDSHDTVRFLTDSKGELSRLRLASAFQFLYIGIPYIYYGDEVGLDGGHDPFCRRCMEWDEKKMDWNLHKHYKGLIALRKGSPAFSRGSFRELKRLERGILFQRQYKDETYWCAFNNSDEPLAMGIPATELLEVTPGRNGRRSLLGSIELPPMTFRVFRAEVNLE